MTNAYRIQLVFQVKYGYNIFFNLAKLKNKQNTDIQKQPANSDRATNVTTSSVRHCFRLAFNSTCQGMRLRAGTWEFPCYRSYIIPLTQ